MIYQDVLCTLFQAMHYKSYLELGIGDGSMVKRMPPHASTVVAVDISPCPLPPGIKVHKMTTQEFFKLPDRGGPFDMIFIDADHNYSSVLGDLACSLENLAPHGTIALHDTDPQELRFIAPSHCNDAYRIVDTLSAYKDLTAITLPVGHEGLTLVRHRLARRVLEYLG